MYSKNIGLTYTGIRREEVPSPDLQHGAVPGAFPLCFFLKKVHFPFFLPQLTCPFCPESTPCMHCFQCNCETFSKLRFCSHLHVVIASHGRHSISSRMAIRPDGAESNTDSDAAVDGGIRRGSTPSPMSSAAFKRKQVRDIKIILADKKQNYQLGFFCR